jgi:hypothetical protein
VNTIRNTPEDTRVTGLQYLSRLAYYGAVWAGEVKGISHEYRPVNAIQKPLGKYQAGRTHASDPANRLDPTY